MTDLVRRMQTQRFRSTILACGNSNNLNFQAIEDEFAYMVIDRNGNSQGIFFTAYDSTVEFMMPSEFEFDSMGEMPGILSNHLLQSNASTKLGFWAVKEIGEKLVYAVMYNVEIEQLTPRLFKNVILDSREKIDELEEALSAMTRSLS